MDTEQPDTPVAQRSLLERSGSVLVLCILGSAAIQFGLVLLSTIAAHPHNELQSIYDSQHLAREISARYEWVFHPEGRLPWERAPQPPTVDVPRASFWHMGTMQRPSEEENLLHSLTGRRPYRDPASGSLAAMFDRNAMRPSELPGPQEPTSGWQGAIERVDVDGEVSKDQIEKYLAHRLDATLKCVSDHERRRGDTAEQHRASLRLDISATGNIDEVEVFDTSMQGRRGGRSLEECLQKTVTSLGSFAHLGGLNTGAVGRDNLGGGGVVTYSTVFRREHRDGWKVRVDPVSVEGVLSDESIEQTIRKDERDLLAACFFLHAQRHGATADQHRLTARLSIDQIWGVEHANITDATFAADEGYDALDACLRRRFKAWRFPIFTAEEPTLATFAITVTRVPADAGRNDAGRNNAGRNNAGRNEARLP